MHVAERKWWNVYSNYSLSNNKMIHLERMETTTKQTWGSREKGKYLEYDVSSHIQQTCSV